MKHFIATALLLSCLGARADTQDHGFTFADTIKVQDTVLVLNGTGLLRVYFFKVYVAGLYLGEGVKPEQFFDDVPKRLELAYLRDFSRKMMVDAGDDALAENVAPDVLARIRPQIDEINALYEDVKEGDRYALTYVPGVGTELALNGVRKGIVGGKEFAAEYYKIWLGKSKVTRALKAELLQGVTVSDASSK